MTAAPLPVTPSSGTSRSGATRPSESLLDAYGATLEALLQEDPQVRVVEAETPGPFPTAGFGERYPERWVRLPARGSRILARAAELSKNGATVFANTTVLESVGESYRYIRESICQPRANVKIIAAHAGFASVGEAPAVEDLGLMRGLPGMTVVVPADAPSTRAATREITRFSGPAYLRLASGALTTVSEGDFAIGRAAERRGGSDLTVVAIGAMVARALELADELARVGISVRVLDFASIKPFDEPALLRAARDTGAILVLEDHSVVTGVGALVAAATAENYPVPVRRLGIPDLFPASDDPVAPLDRYGLSPERLRDEAWELLRIRGKVQ